MLLKMSKVNVSWSRFEDSKVELLEVHKELLIALLNGFSVFGAEDHQVKLFQVGTQLAKDAAQLRAIKVIVSKGETIQLQLGNLLKLDQVGGVKLGWDKTEVDQL